MVHEALAAAEELQSEGFGNRSRRSAHGEAARYRHRAGVASRAPADFCVGEAFPWGGVTAEVIARVASEGFHLLDAAPAAAQRQGHARSVSSESLGDASADTRSSIAAKARKFFANELISHAAIPIIMPQLGESIAEATIVSINVKPGDKSPPTRTSSKSRPTRRSWA